MAEGKKILEGIRVVEAAVMVFGPSVGAILSDFGAEVIKIEPPGMGDTHRYGHKLPQMPISDIPYTFEVDNRNKKSIVLNLKTDDGQDIFKKLISRADIFITSHRTSALKKLKLTYEDLKPLNQRLIHAHALGYGETGPEAHKPGYDQVTYWARSALETNMIPDEGWPGRIPYASGDHPSGWALLNAIMFALYNRERTGEGTAVTCSLLDCGAWANANMIMGALCGAEWQARPPRSGTFFAFRHQKTSDGRLLKLNINDHQRLFGTYCQAMGRPDLIDDPRFKTLEARVENIAEFNAIIDLIYTQHDMAYWVKRHKEFDIACSPLATYQEVAADPQMAANGTFIEVDHPRHGKFRTIDSPFTVKGHDKVKPGIAPELGEHTRTVLADLGLSEEDIDKVIANGAVVQNKDF